MRVIAKRYLGRNTQAGSVDQPSKLPIDVPKTPTNINITMTDGRFAILRPKQSVPEDCQITITSEKEVLLDFLRNVTLVDSDDAVSFDTETTGTWIFGNKDFKMVTLGVGHGMKAVSLDTRKMASFQIRKLLQDVRSVCVEKGIKLIAHNLFYDASVVAFYLGGVQGIDAAGWMPYKYCTYALFRYLSSEGFNGQSHSLKFAMKELMLWSNTNETDQHEWLINSGYITGPKGIHNPDNKLSDPAARLAAVQQGLAEGKDYKPDKGMMYKVPHSILGKYNALDCFATYRFYRDILLPAMNKYTVDFFKFWHGDVMMLTIRNAVDNYQQGINIDKEILSDYREYMDRRLHKLYKKFGRGKMRETYQLLAARLFDKYVETKKPKAMYKQVKVREAKPRAYTKAGYLTAGWIKHEVKRRAELRTQAVLGDQRLSKSGLQYIGRIKLLKKYIKDGKIALDFPKNHWAYKFLFNPGSIDHKAEYLFHNVQYEVIPSKKEKMPDRLRLKNGVEVDMSDSGRLPTGKSAITAIGGRKHILNIFNREIKKYQFVDNTYNKVLSSTDGLLHVGYKVPGTNTQRLSGDGGLNLQNMVKDPDFLKAWQTKHPETEILCQLDLTAVEPHVFTEFSRDKSMLTLYGPGAKPNDVYLFTGAGIGGAIGEPFKKLGYDPLNPTKEAMKACKEQHKGLRNVAKSLLLSDDYGSGAYKKWQTLKIQGFDYTLKQVEEMHNKLAEVYKGKREFSAKLQREWEKNRGFVLDGFGFPVCVNDKKIKDLSNRCIQKTGHMILQLLQYFVVHELWRRNIKYRWHLMDFHDEFIAVVDVKDVKEVTEIYAESLKKVNAEYLCGLIKIKAEPQLATCLAEIKVENYVYEPFKEYLEKANASVSEK